MMCTRRTSVALLIVVAAAGLAAQEADVVKLPAPRMTGGKPLMDCLKARQSGREYSADQLSLQVLSDLLWAADGYNRPEASKRTAPSANNVQNIDIYAVMADGVFLYDVKEHVLKKVLAEDLRAVTGSQDFVKIVPLNLIFVADFAKISRGTVEDKRFYSGTHAGFISQNVYLYCASEGLSTVVRGLVDREAVSKALNLRADQYVAWAQSVGYPKK